MLNYRPEMFNEASKSHAPKKLAVILLCFIAVFAAIFVLESIAPSIVSTKPMIEEMRREGYLDGDQEFTLKESMKLAAKVSSASRVMIPTLLSTIFGTIAALFYCRCIEMRPVRSMGARKKGLIPHYLMGLVIGTAMMSAITLLSAAFGANSIELCSNINYKVIALFLLGFFVQGMSEEFIFRGYLMTTIGGSGYHTVTAVSVSALAFTLAHAANPGFGVIPAINLTLFGVFAALYMILFDNIWGVCAIHSIWNFTQGSLYGISVSGSGDTESVFRTIAVSDHPFLTGGEFGIEGSIFTTIVLCVGIGAVCFFINKKKTAEKAP